MKTNKLFKPMEKVRHLQNISELYSSGKALYSLSKLKKLKIEQSPHYYTDFTPEHYRGECERLINQGHSDSSTIVLCRNQNDRPYHVMFNWEWYQAFLKNGNGVVLVVMLKLDEDYERMLYNVLVKEYENFPEMEIEHRVFEIADEALRRLVV